MKFGKMSVPFAPHPGISGIFGRMESAPGHSQSRARHSRYGYQIWQRTEGRLYFLVPRLPVCLFVTTGQSQRYGTISLFLNKLHHRVRHTRVHSVRIFADAARGKWVSKFPMAHNSKGLCLYVKFCLSIFFRKLFQFE